jgi:HEAT repeat protein
MVQFRRATRMVIFVTACITVVAGSLRAGAENTPSVEKERELIALLRSDAPGGDKAVACKLLAVHGSEEAVPELARLLSDERLASWARIALEVIPGRAADDALRQSLNSLNGNLLIGAINSIGVRRDANAVEPLAARLEDPASDVASSAAVALGRIGNANAATVLRKALSGATPAVRTSVAEGCILCAERFLAEGRAEEAAAIYDEVRKAEVPRQRRLEATRGAILSRKQGGIPLLIEQLRSSDKVMNQLALSTAREMPGREVADALVAEIPKSTPDQAALVLQAIADRNDTAVLPAVLKAASAGPKPVRLAAIAAVGRLGDATCLEKLVELALERDADLSRTAKGALVGLPGATVDAEIVARISKDQGKAYPVLLELVGERRISATAQLIKAVEHRDSAVRGAALTALGATVDAKGLPILIAQVVSPKNADDAPIAQQALRTAAVRMPDREACAGELARAIGRAPVSTKSVLLKILGEMGGAKALETIGAAARDADPQLQDVASRLLGEWMNVDAGPLLLELSKPASGSKYQGRALRGYIRLARQFQMPEDQRAVMCKNAFDAATQPAEKKLVLDVLKRYPSIDGLKLSIQALQIAELKEDATGATLAIAQKLGSNAAEVRDLLSKAGMEPVKVEIVKAEYGSDTAQKDVTETLRKHVGDLALIALPNQSFNASFGGDPSPGTPKRLKIVYKINGKSGETTFPENSLIVLPMPK